MRKFTSYPSNYVKASEGKYYPSYDERLEFANRIPLEELWNKLRDLTELPDLQFEYEIKNTRGDVCITFTSQDLADQIGFLELAFRTFKIASFNSSVGYDDKKNELYLWCTIDFRYDLQEMGSNGAQFLTAWYSDSEGWTFRTDKDRRIENESYMSRWD